MNEKHPVIQIFYLGLITGGLWIFGIEILPMIPNPYVSDYHLAPIAGCVIATYGCFLKASFSDPGRLDSVSASVAAEIWPIDHVLYDHKQCRTCLIERPARSKHCPVCKMCVAKLEYH